MAKTFAMSGLIFGLACLIQLAAAQSRDCYLTKQAVQGNTAARVCAANYHMASVTEIYVGIPYNTALGQTTSDAGSGPPLMVFGWVRTGQQRSDGRNCNGWSANTVAVSGLIGGFVSPSSIALKATVNNKPVVNNLDQVVFGALPGGDGTVVPYASCNLSKPVWCVHD